MVVVAILGILSAVGIVSYNGYISSAERNSAQNLMQQISLGQSEFFSDKSNFYSVTENTCTPTVETLSAIYEDLLGSTSTARATVKANESAYVICISRDVAGSTDYLITAENETTRLTLNSEGDKTNDVIIP